MSADNEQPGPGESNLPQTDPMPVAPPEPANNGGDPAPAPEPVPEALPAAPAYVDPAPHEPRLNGPDGLSDMAKRWIRREIALAAMGWSRESREEHNP